MHFKNLTLILATIIVFVLYFENCTAQQTNLLQAYIKQYFSDYFTSNVRSYKLYGNGQMGAADFHAGLPFDLDKEGKVNSLIYSTQGMAAPKASPKSTQVLADSGYVYPGYPANFYPSASNGQPIFRTPVYQQSRSDILKPNLPDIRVTNLDPAVNNTSIKIDNNPKNLNGDSEITIQSI